MAGTGATAVVALSTNGDGAAVSGEGDANSGIVISSFSIDISAYLFPSAVRIALIDAHMAGIISIAVVSLGTNGDGAAVNGE